MVYVVKVVRDGKTKFAIYLAKDPKKLDQKVRKLKQATEYNAYLLKNIIKRRRKTV